MTSFKFYQMPTLVTSAKLKPLDKFILSEIYTYTIHKKPFLQSNKEIARFLRTSVSSVKRSFPRLIKTGWIKKDIIYDAHTGLKRRLVTKINVKKMFGVDLRKYQHTSNFVDCTKLNKFLNKMRKIILALNKTK